MDPFSITLGVLQFTGTALKISALIYLKVKIFRNYSREVKRVLKGFDRQRKNFIHEIHLFLRQAQQNEDDIECMLDDVEHPKWRSQELQVGLETAFGKSLDTCRDVIEEIAAILDSLEGELCCFDEITAMCSENESVKAAARRLRKKVKISFNKSKFEEQIKNLRELNDDLRRLRGQVAEIKKPLSCPNVALARRPVEQLSQEYGSIGKVRRASEALHQALAAAWLRSLDPSSVGGVQHNVRLLLNTPSIRDVQMELVVSCHGHRQSCLTSIPSQPKYSRLRVESQIVDFMESAFSTPPAFDPDAHDGRRKRRKVRFAGDDTQDDQSSSEATDGSPDPVDLRNVQDICSVFSQKNTACRAPKSLGYLDGSANYTFRHSFFESSSAQALGNTPIRLSEILSQPVETSVNFVDQLKLARNFVMAVLKFHSTPWLREHHSLQDLSFLPSSEGDVSSCLQTAHLSLNFIHHPPDESFSSELEDMEKREAIETARLTYGIRNLALWSLGAVMLQIGTWSTIEHHDDVVNVRRLAQRVPMLGQRYRDLTKQCLECDFAFGDDLSKPKLQQAVYENVVCGLTEMIGSLDIGDE